MLLLLVFFFSYLASKYALQYHQMGERENKHAITFVAELEAFCNLSMLQWKCVQISLRNNKRQNHQCCERERGIVYFSLCMECIQFEYTKLSKINYLNKKRKYGKVRWCVNLCAFCSTRCALAKDFIRSQLRA